ncbi:hypothetical protein ACFL47_00375 [Candidatus Latescibacterota bacterium]
MFALDYDGTIADTNAIKTRWISDNLGLDVAPYSCDHTWCAPIIGEEDYKHMSGVVYNHENTIAAKPIHGAPEALKELAAHGPVYIATARDSSSSPYAAEWLEVNGLMKYIERIVPWVGTPKIMVARSLGCRALVDDDIRHLETMPPEGMKLLLIKPDFEGTADIPEEVTLCTKWERIVEEATAGL